MTIDKRLVQITVDAYCAHQSTDGSLNKAIEEALEAYEAAKWQPVEEVPDHGDGYLLTREIKNNKYHYDLYRGFKKDTGGSWIEENSGYELNKKWEFEDAFILLPSE